MEHAISEVGLGGTTQIYTASFEPTVGVQDYDLQEIVQASTTTVTDAVNVLTGTFNPDNHRLIIRKIYYKSPHAMWRFYGYYGGISVVGNYSTYGQYSDDSTFEIVPTWQNKLQAIMYEDSIFTRTSHYSYELINNKLRLFPNPSYWDFAPLNRIWFKFYVDNNAWDEDDDYRTGIKGINNMNTLPFANIPYININSIGKQWIRRFALSLCKEMLGLVRSKFATIPIPGESVTLNGSELITQGKQEQDALRDELKTTLDEIDKRSEFGTLYATASIVSGSHNNIFTEVLQPNITGSRLSETSQVERFFYSSSLSASIGPSVAYSSSFDKSDVESMAITTNLFRAFIKGTLLTRDNTIDGEEPVIINEVAPTVLKTQDSEQSKLRTE